MKKFTVPVLGLLVLLIASFNSTGQNVKEQAGNAVVQLIQFHSEHRCYTCLKIERLAKTTLTNHFASMPFLLINVEDKKNKKVAEDFQATGTALFLYNTKTGKKKDLTEFAFMKAGNEKGFEAELKKQIEEFIKEV